MKTPAIIASLTVAGSIAFAAGQQSGGKQSPPMPSGAQAHSMQEEIPEARMALADCPSGVPLNWFSPTPRLVPCTGGLPSDFRPLLTAVFGPADVNGDGVIEFWGPLYNPNTNSSILINGTPTLFRQEIWVSRLDPTSLAPTSIQDPVTVVPSDFGAWVQAMWPGTQSAQVELEPNSPRPICGFRDMDGDGDLDYLLVLKVDGLNQRQVWFENVGYERPSQPVAADLNGDGQVNGADLGLLLVAWGPNP